MNTRANSGFSRNKSNYSSPSSQLSESKCSCASAVHAKYTLAIASGLISHFLLGAANIFSIAATQLNKTNSNSNPNDFACSLHPFLPPCLSEGTQAALIQPCTVSLCPLPLVKRANLKEPTKAHTTSAAFHPKRRAVQSPAHDTESLTTSSTSIESHSTSKRSQDSDSHFLIIDNRSKQKITRGSTCKSRRTRVASDTSSSFSSSLSISDSSSDSINTTLRKRRSPVATKRISPRAVITKRATARAFAATGASRSPGNAAKKAHRVEGNSSISSYPLRSRSTRK